MTVNLLSNGIFSLSDDQESEGDNIMVTDKCDKNRNKCRAKFLSFTENRRPAFYGTWSKKSDCITARKPLGQDEVNTNYIIIILLLIS